MGKEVHRWEHYREWLATQNVLNSMRDSDIRAMWYSNIPSCAEGRLHEVVVMTLITTLAVIIIMFGAPQIKWNHTKWFALDVVKKATSWSIAPTPHGCLQIIMSLMMPMRFMNKKVINRRRPFSLRRLKRPLNIQWTLMVLNMILGTMSSHSTHLMNTSKLKGATGIVTLSISAPLEKSALLKQRT